MGSVPVSTQAGVNEGVGGGTTTCTAVGRERVNLLVGGTRAPVFVC